MKEYKIGVMGPHLRGMISLMSHQPDRGFRIAALCGKNQEGLERYYERCGPEVRFTTDYRKIVRDPEIDIVFVCTPDYMHLEHALPALEAGKYVFLEKPMAIRIEDCDRLIEAAERNGRRLYVGHNMRFFPVVRKMKELIDNGKIGDVEAIWCRHFVGDGGDYYFKNYNSERELTTSLLLQKGAHDIDIIHWLAGAYSTGVTGMGKLSVYNRVTDRRKPEEGVLRPKRDRRIWPPLTQTGLSPIIDVEDHNMLLMQLSNGVQAAYLECFYSPDYHRNYTVIGTEGRLENYGDHSTDQCWAKIHLWNRRCDYSELGHEVISVPPAKGGHGGADPSMIEDFLRFVETGRSAGAPPIDARMAVAVGCLGAESIRTRKHMLEIPAVTLDGDCRSGSANRS